MKYFVLFFVLLVGCGEASKTYDPQELINEAIMAHGMKLKEKKVSFDFRDRRYSVLRESIGYTYTRSWQDDSLGFVEDVLVNSRDFTRYIDSVETDVDDEWAQKYSSSVNSVLYFFQVPYVLNDAAAIKKFMGEFEMTEQKYFGVQVTFSEDGGGEDHEDVFIYWIHSENKTVDFFAYSYLTEGGGVRFREAINRREIKGLVVQDYVNYKADKSTPLTELPDLFNRQELEELSKILNENVRVEQSGELN